MRWMTWRAIYDCFYLGPGRDAHTERLGVGNSGQLGGCARERRAVRRHVDGAARRAANTDGEDVVGKAAAVHRDRRAAARTALGVAPRAQIESKV